MSLGGFDRESAQVCALRSRSRRLVHLQKFLDLARGFVHAANLDATSQLRFVKIRLGFAEIYLALSQKAEQPPESRKCDKFRRTLRTFQ